MQLVLTSAVTLMPWMWPETCCWHSKDQDMTFGKTQQQCVFLWRTDKTSLSTVTESRSLSEAKKKKKKKWQKLPIVMSIDDTEQTRTYFWTDTTCRVSSNDVFCFLFVSILWLNWLKIDSEVMCGCVAKDRPDVDLLHRFFFKLIWVVGLMGRPYLLLFSSSLGKCKLNKGIVVSMAWGGVLVENIDRWSQCLHLCKH